MLSVLNFDLLSVGIAVAAMVILGYVVFGNDRESVTNRAFALFSIWAVIWGVSNYLNYQFHTPLAILWVLRAHLFISVWYAYFLFRLLLVFPRKQASPNRTLVLASTSVAVVTAILTLTPYVFSGVAEVAPLGQVTNPERGPQIALFAIAAAYLVFGGIAFLVRNMRKANGIEKIQIKYVLAGILTTFSLIITFNLVLPVFFNQLRFIPFGSIFTLPLVVFTAYAIIRHHLLSVKVITTEILAFVLAVTNFFEVLLSDNGYELIFRSIVFILILGLGIFLIKSVRKEVEQREEVALLADSLEKANLRLQELDKQKTEFLSIASHQLRTPLSILKGYIELIRDGAYGKVGPKMIPTLDNMDESNERLIHLIDEFLNISRIEQGRTKYTFAKAQINDTVTSVVEEQTNRAKDKGMKLVWKADSKLDQIVIDEEKVRHVIFNFVDNAIKYSEKGSVTVVAKRDDSGVVVTVTDEGLGFNKVDEANFYQKFYRGENVKGVNVGGTGLGLYVCRKFIEAHGGHVWAKSPGLGKGSEFGLWLPLSPSKELLEAAKKA